MIDRRHTEIDEACETRSVQVRCSLRPGAEKATEPSQFPPNTSPPQSQGTEQILLLDQHENDGMQRAFREQLRSTNDDEAIKPIG